MGGGVSVLLCEECAEEGALDGPDVQLVDSRPLCALHRAAAMPLAMASEEPVNGVRPGGELKGQSDLDRFLGSLLTDEQLEDMPPPAWLIDGQLVRDSIAVLYGASGGYKTFLVLSWMLSISTGSWWFGREVQQGPVLMIAAEGSGGLGRRIAAWKQHGRYHGNAGLMVRPEPVNLLDRGQASVVATAAKRMGAVFVVVDTVARSMDGGDEDKARDMNVLVAALDVIRRESAACVLAVHHTGKDTERGLRGSSSLFAAAATVIEAKGAEHRLVLSHRKQKEAELPPDLHLGVVQAGESLVVTDRPPVAVGLPDTARAMLEALNEIADEDGVSAGLWYRSMRTEGGVLTVTERTFRRYVKTLCEDGHADKHGKGNQARYTLSEQGQALLER